MPVRTVAEGKERAEGFAAEYGHQLGEWDGSDQTHPDVENQCTHNGCDASVGVDKEHGTLSFSKNFKTACNG